ncbi:alkaline phosphatase PhoX [Qipengyuania sp. DSG2-2]|uniref:alkaline phosphatase PhoX n=1 Tax=Qipengyuania sp. DGS2-2 TaxID=3349631 RepID=UPI0036D31911
MKSTSSTVGTEVNRRRFLAATGSAFAALSASGCSMASMKSAPVAKAARGQTGFGPLVSDPAGMLDLPEGFSYRILSRLGDTMDDGLSVPDKADGMGCLDLGGGKIALVRNHELIPSDGSGGTLKAGYGKHQGNIVPGGTTTLVLDAETLRVEQQYRSLAGTIRNCSGGITPWGSWLTCEEAPTGPGQRYGAGLEQNHGWVFEVPAGARRQLEAVPLTAMGRFNHEAACVDPRTGIVYMTEDRDDSVFYRFLPEVPGDLAKGGRLQAMAAVDGTTDSRNWPANDMQSRMSLRAPKQVRWIDLDDVEAPQDDLRTRAAAQGALLIARGEGLHMGLDEMYICSTSGGAAGYGQIFRLMPGYDGAADRFELFFESESPDQFNFGDNLVTSPFGDLIVCEDQYTDPVDNHLRGITPAGQAYAFGRLHRQTELAGGCFSPDGKWFFVNIYSPTMTVAITGPWA